MLHLKNGCIFVDVGVGVGVFYAWRLVFGVGVGYTNKKFIFCFIAITFCGNLQIRSTSTKKIETINLFIFVIFKIFSGGDYLF